jgi:glycosyltransferase involved in cell wall biosynthesis
MMRFPAMARAEVDLVFAKPRPDVVYIRSHLVSNLVAHWCVWKGIPYVEEVNSTGTDAGKVYPVLRYMRGLSRRASAWRWRHAAVVIVVTPVLKEIVSRAAPATSVEVVATGANTSLFHAPLDQPSPIDGPYVIFFGSLAPWHDLATMLAAVKLASWPTSVRLVILGSGQQARLAEEVARRNHQVFYEPVVPYTEVPVWIGHALAGLSLLRTANGLSASPLKLYESMACSVPVIVSEAPGQADLVRETGSGLVIPESDPVALAAAVATLWKNPGESGRMGERGRRAVESSHSWDIRAEQTHQILSRVVCPVTSLKTKLPLCRD